MLRMAGLYFMSLKCDKAFANANVKLLDNAKKFFFYCANQVSIVSMYPTMDGSGSIPIVLTTSVTLSISGSMDNAFKK